MPITAGGTSGEAVLLSLAAHLIRRSGYNHAAPADPGPGHSASSALCQVTMCDPGQRHAEDCEALHRRLAGYLYLTGRVSGPADYMPWVVERWEIPAPGGAPRAAPEVAAVLDQAAAVLTPGPDLSRTADAEATLALLVARMAATGLYTVRGPSLACAGCATLFAFDDWMAMLSPSPAAARAEGILDMAIGHITICLGRSGRRPAQPAIDAPPATASRSGGCSD
jgi:hypothetical protein